MKSIKLFLNRSSFIDHSLSFGIFVFIMITVFISCDSMTKKNTITPFNHTGESTVMKTTYTSSYFIRKKFGKVVVDDKVFESTVDEYDSDGRLISRLDSGILDNVEKSVYIYDEKGNNIEINITDEYGTLQEKKVNKINESGNIYEQTTYNSAGEEIAVFKFDYDKMGNQISRKTYINEQYKFTTSYKYDNKGNIIYEWDGSIKNGQMTYDYEFDQKGNWIKGSKYEGGKKWLILKRDITYY